MIEFSSGNVMVRVSEIRIASWRKTEGGGSDGKVMITYIDASVSYPIDCTQDEWKKAREILRLYKFSTE